ncbi:hypothetical protein [Desulfofustis limnaeus]|jgi:hypothetical protein|uniref:Type II toxin-antitoxin system RelE/ParE family toxin n=1 Tax=Desulfofustis limnaeus TaxID=2740163 RepID=A0ABM7WBU4_9BACT|nr:hypothetical protein [Desulfofustis limnaeus]MDX9895848.1 hypothetical protein [Desulfofustis sp.]BDD88429.1 hypothetical protein DPPLL_27940 [Desulfofustis limnaeus]
MLRSIHLARAIKRQLATMRRSGKKGDLAANQCERILAELKANGTVTTGLFAKRTKNGEYRLKNCIKYDLGSGYRLVTIRCGDRLYVPFLGTHDEADIWLERHRTDDFLPNDPSFQREPVSSRTEALRHSPNPDRQEQEIVDLYEEQLLQRLDEATLKSVFTGLFRRYTKTNDSQPG